MNTKNNRKFQETDAHICATFLDLLETHDFDNISISLLCQKAGITRATFYSHFGDMNHFFDAVAQRLFLELRDEDCANFRKMDSQGELHHASILSLFEHILKYRSFYQVYITRVTISVCCCHLQTYRGHSKICCPPWHHFCASGELLRYLLLHRTNCHDPHVAGRRMSGDTGRNVSTYALSSQSK